MAPPKPPRPAPEAPTPAKPTPRGGSIAWTAVKVLVGLACYALACALAFVVMEHALSTVAAGLIVAVGAVLVPLALTQVLVPALRRLDPATGFASTFIGMSGLCAVLTLVALPLSARGPVSRALGDLGQRHPKAGAVPIGAARAVSRLLAEPAADAGVADAGARDAGTRDAGARDAGAAVAGDVLDAAVATADVAADAEVSDAVDGDVSDAAADVVDAGDAAADVVEEAGGAEREVFAEVTPCGEGQGIGRVMTGDVEGDARDEVVVQCARSLRVIALSEGRLRERVRYETAAPGDLEAGLGAPALADMNDDGRRDLVICEHYTTARGGGRGGVTWFMANLGDGRWGAVAAVDRTDGCGGVAVGDVTGDGRPELLIAHVGNPYAPAPAGRLAWFVRSGRAWQRRGSYAVRTWPDGVTLEDVNGDSILDAVVSHGWSSDDGAAVLPGARTGLRAVDPALAAPAAADPMLATGRFDDDATPDSAAVERGDRLVFRRSAASDEVVREVIPGAVVSPPIPRRDAGAADAAGDDEGG